ncbi:MAG: tRNA (adenosine(37)-N6)-threonylcarbamoyltransferase complex ATPase subunit type 1 TsaE [Candidatus Omnitrophota bacterium]|jgi:tRNA threonylcarbamoyladenosine biosynthesis protein TsaE
MKNNSRKKNLKLVSVSPGQTREIGSRLARALAPGDVIFLRGRLGSGKTVFAKGIAAGLGINAAKVISPTFVLIREYRGGRIPLYHFDLYRLDGPQQAAPLGLEEYIQGNGVCVVEWPEKLGCMEYSQYLQVNIGLNEQGKKEQRVLEFIPRGERYLRLLESLK